MQNNVNFLQQIFGVRCQKLNEKNRCELPYAYISIGKEYGKKSIHTTTHIPTSPVHIKRLPEGLKFKESIGVVKEITEQNLPFFKAEKRGNNMCVEYIPSTHTILISSTKNCI